MVYVVHELVRESWVLVVHVVRHFLLFSDCDLPPDCIKFQFTSYGVVTGVPGCVVEGSQNCLVLCLDKFNVAFRRLTTDCVCIHYNRLDACLVESGVYLIVFVEVCIKHIYL